MNSRDGKEGQQLDARAVRRLRSKCERAKWSISSNTNKSIEVDQPHFGIDQHTSIWGAKFEELCIDLFKQMIIPDERFMQDTHIHKGVI